MVNGSIFNVKVSRKYLVLRGVMLMGSLGYYITGSALVCTVYLVLSG
jgi:hypothetical protein